jgi:CheY-like chemotaxis protein
MFKTGQKTILLVEDEVILALMETRQLENEGYSVILTGTGEKAVEIANADHDRIDLILMDIDLGPGMNGVEAAKKILEFNDIPVLFLSSHIEKEIVEQTEKVSNYGYVVKNSSFTVLDASIKMAFKLYEAHSSIRNQKMQIEAAYEEMQVTNEQLLESENQLRKSESSIRNKLKAILEPEGDTDTLELEDVIDTELLNSLMEEFYQLTGILGAVLDISGKVLVASGWQDVCTKFHRCKSRKCP